MTGFTVGALVALAFIVAAAVLDRDRVRYNHEPRGVVVVLAVVLGFLLVWMDVRAR